MPARRLLAAIMIAALATPATVTRTASAEELLEARPTKSTAPRLPGKARRDQVAGYAIIAVTVGDGGVVTDTEILAEAPERYGFGRSAEIAVRQWEFADTPPGRYRVSLTFY